MLPSSFLCVENAAQRGEGDGLDIDIVVYKQGLTTFGCSCFDDATAMLIPKWASLLPTAKQPCALLIIYVCASKSNVKNNEDLHKV